MLTLYYSDTCSQCAPVLAYIEEEDLELEYKNLSKNSSYMMELFKLGGKMHVPMLLIDGFPMYDARQILDYLEEHRDLLKRGQAF